jgi:predicted DNA-binding protein
MKRLTISIDDRAYERLTELSEQGGASKAWHVRKAIARYLVEFNKGRSYPSHMKRPDLSTK